MMKHWLVIFVLLIVSHDANAERVTEIANNHTLVLEDGRKILLTGLDFPKVQPLANQARKALSALVLHQEVRLEMIEKMPDRWERLWAQIYLENGQWVQEEMVKQGMARVFPDQNNCLKYMPELLQIEQKARKERKGLWANRSYRTRNAADYLKQDFDSFQLVQGTVFAVKQVRQYTYLNFGEDWKKDFTAVIQRKDLRKFKELDVFSLENRLIRVRGWLYPRNGPMIDVICPNQIEILPTETQHP